MAPPSRAAAKEVRTTVPRRRSVGLRRKSAKKQMLLIVNPYATTVSDRLKNLVVYALQGRYEVETVDTEAQNHATEIGREVRDHGYDIVVAFGGDGTLNEVANGLAGTDVPVSVLPGGSTNVVCRTLGIPNDVVDATEHLLALVDEWQPRKIDLGKADGRHFVFSCGVGIDATVVKRVDAHPRLKSRAGPYYYTWATVSAFYRSYLVNPVRMRVEDRHRRRQPRASPRWPRTPTPSPTSPAAPSGSARASRSTTARSPLGVLKRAAQRDMPTLIATLFSETRPAARHRQIEHFEGVTAATIDSISETKDGVLRPFPVQVDGDYIGEKTELTLKVDPGALTVVA